MLADFQTALADLTASPALCRAVRAAPELLCDRYTLTQKELRQLAGIAASPGMAANCMLYRANRLAPVALNLPATCETLGEALAPLLSEYWDGEPITDVHFLVETDRFCRFLAARDDLPPGACEALAREHGIVAVKLTASRGMGRSFAAAGGEVPPIA